MKRKDVEVSESGPALKKAKRAIKRLPPRVANFAARLEFKSLQANGHCVVPNVISKEEVESIKKGFWDWLEGFNTGIKVCDAFDLSINTNDLQREDSKTWTAKNWPPSIHGIIQQLRIGQQGFVWEARQNRKIAQVFADLWGVKPEELLVSFDGAFASFAPKSSEKAWPHVDQGPRLQGVQCVQGFINLMPCDESQGGLVVWDKSHLKHEEYFTKLGKLDAKGDWHKFDEKDMQFFGDCKRIKVCHFFWS